VEIKDGNMRTKQLNKAKKPKRNGKRHESLTIEYSFRYEGEISEQKIKEIENKKQEISHKYGKDLVAFAIENCQRGADIALKLTEVLLKLKII
jgi:hypothetical protein